MCLVGGARNPGNQNGGGGGGGFREDKSPVTPFTASPLDGAGPITVTATDFPITIGAGGAGISQTSSNLQGNDGTPSTFSTITSAGGGGGGWVVVVIRLQFLVVQQLITKVQQQTLVQQVQLLGQQQLKQIQIQVLQQ